MADFDKIIVICAKCGAMAPYDPPVPGHLYGTWHWHQPCPKCGAESWASHEVNRDWRTGRSLPANEPRFHTKP